MVPHLRSPHCRCLCSTYEYFTDAHNIPVKLLQYDNDGGRSIRTSVRGGLGNTTDRKPESITAPPARSGELESPLELLNYAGSDEKVREGNAKNLLLDFFGI